MKKKIILKEKENTTQKIKSTKGNKNSYQIILGLIFLATLGSIFFLIREERKADEKEQEAQESIWHAQKYFEAGKNKKALYGDGLNLGFFEIHKKWGNTTKAGTLAAYYIGIIYLRKKKYKKAIDMFDQVNFSDPLVQSRLLIAKGDAYSELKKNKEAIVTYEQAAASVPSGYTIAEALLKIAYLYYAEGKYEKACDFLIRISKEFPKSLYYIKAQKMLGYIDGLNIKKK